VEESLARLRRAQLSLRSRFDDFRAALERRDGPAYRLGLADFQAAHERWSAALERALLPALARAPVAGRDSCRELKLEFVQLRELARQLRAQIESGARLSDVLGLAENLGRRLDAHEKGLTDVYLPAAAGALTDAERAALEAAAGEL
jgi:hypothetical protein